MAESHEPSEARLPAETVINRILDVQESELQTRGRELDVRETEIKANADYTKAALNAQVADRENERAAQDRVHKRNTWFAAALASVLALGAVGLVVIDKEAILFEIIKLTAVFVGAYQWGRFARRKSGEPD